MALGTRPSVDPSPCPLFYHTPDLSVQLECSDLAMSGAGSGAGAGGKAKGKLYAHQDSLPSLPVPSLDETLPKFLSTVKPLVTPEEYEHTVSVVDAFKSGVGPQLQKMLEERGESERNWIEEWWEQFAYLQPRYPIAVNINWHCVLPSGWGSTEVSQVESAAMLSRHLLKVREVLVNETLEPEVMAKQTLCMYQYSRAFNSCRVPGVDADEIVTYPHTMKHIVVLIHDEIYVMDVLDSEGAILSHADLVLGFNLIREAGARTFIRDTDTALSVLTSENRTSWAKARNYLKALDPKNAASLDIIESALFVISLDDETSHDIETLARATLHGNGHNKWFDKPMNLVVFKNGRAGLNGEHTWADAMVAVTIFGKVMDNINAEVKKSGFPATHPAGHVSSRPAPRKLQWKLDDAVIEAVELACSNASKLIRTVDLSVLEFRHYGKGFMKRHRLLPDFYMQQAIQLAYYRLHHEVTATYETGHTRLFYHGRTETIKATTCDSVAFTKAMDDPTVDSKTRFALLKAAIATHSTFARDALAGRGVDRHLMGLYILSEMSGISPRPAIFSDKGFLKAKKYHLSTSNVSNGAGGFMAATEEGYGVCYGIFEGLIVVNISSYALYPATSAARYKKALEDALMDMQRMVLENSAAGVGISKL